MTLCELITNPITRMVEKEGKNLDEIAEAVCPKVEYGREKIIRIIKDFLGEEYLIQHAETLKYDIEKAQLAKKRIRSTTQKTHQKIDATEHSDSSKSKLGESTKHENKGACSQQCGKQCGKQEPKQCSKQEHDSDKPMAFSGSRESAHDFDELVKEVRRLVDLFSMEDVKKALAVVEGADSKKQLTD
jgi:vacuolar-type H+-ATPase catalytic subunit A/Vma1